MEIRLRERPRTRTTGVRPRGDQVFACGGAMVHVTQKPVEIMQQLVQVCLEGGTVLDPCTGSGSTGVAALREGRRFVGVELSSPYADVGGQRLRAELTKDAFTLTGPEA